MDLWPLLYITQGVLLSFASCSYIYHLDTSDNGIIKSILASRKIKENKLECFCRRLQPATILTGLIAALTRFPELLVYAYVYAYVYVYDYIIGSGKRGRFMNNLSQLLIYDESNQPPLQVGVWHMTYHNIYTSQNNFKSSSTTRNWRKLQHLAILSCWCHFWMLRLSKNSYLDDSAHEFWNFWWFHTFFIGLFKNIC